MASTRRWPVPPAPTRHRRPRTRAAGGAASPPPPKRLELALFLRPGAGAVPRLRASLPIVLAVFYSVFNWNGLGALDDFVGLDNYRRALSDPVFRGALAQRRSSSLSLVLQLPIALGLALLLNRRFRGRAVLRIVFFAPYVLSEVIDGRHLAADAAARRPRRPGPDAVGARPLRPAWLADPDIVLYTLFVVITGSTSGSASSCFLAGLQGIPRGAEEAAAIDGASRLAEFAARDAAAARADDPDLGLPVDHRFAAALRPDLGHDRRRAGRRVEHDGDVHDRPRLQPLQFGYGNAVAVSCSSSRSSSRCCSNASSFGATSRAP